MTVFILPEGTEVLEGTCAEAFGEPGGAHQYYVPDLSRYQKISP